MYIGHKREDGTIQPLKAHLDAVAQIAGIFADAFGAQPHAKRTGRMHDAGKYSRAGQGRMTDPSHTSKVDHSTAGAKIALERCQDGFAALAIAGHHGGMPDYGGRFSAEGDGTLMGRFRKKLSGDLDYSPFWDENEIAEGPLIPQWINPRLNNHLNPFAMPFYVRMLFSCLVDADFLDTECFMQDGDSLRGNHEDMAALLDKLQAHIQPWLENPCTQINVRRCEILRDCITAGEGSRGLYSLTVPTGGGKTVSSLAFALTHAVKNGMDRVIYVIPYTSIIEQNAAVFRQILGEDNVIEHHSGVDWDADEDMEDQAVMRQMLASENWDAPVIVTTAVQFFESLFSNKPSRCRKLHNIANSVVIFDEAQMLPLPCLKPCVSAIAELVEHYGVSAVLCTATQPALNRFFSEYSRDMTIREICKNPSELQDCFRRVHFKRESALSEEQLSEKLSRCEQVLCVVNTRRRAQAVFAALPEEGRFHLSTRMTPNHRMRVLREIRERLRQGETCRVVSTSLIEAGVDVDFPEVWREMAGLDSILQAAGRCNREGRFSASECAVVIFTLEGGMPKGMQPSASAAEADMEDMEALDDGETIRRYFERLYWMRGDQSLDDKNIMEKCPTLMLRSIAEAFHLIEEDTRTIYIPAECDEDDLTQLRMGLVNRRLMRRLGRGAVSVYPWDWEKLETSGQLEHVGGGMGILREPSAYDAEYGLKVDSQPGNGLWT